MVNYNRTKSYCETCQDFTNMVDAEVTTESIPDGAVIKLRNKCLKCKTLGPELKHYNQWRRDYKPERKERD